MGGFQPFRMPDPGSVSDSIRAFGDSIRELGESRRRARLDREQAQLAHAREAREAASSQLYARQVEGQLAAQRRADEAATRERMREEHGIRQQIGDFLSQGQPQKARMLAESYGMTLNAPDVQGGSAVPDQLDGGRSLEAVDDESAAQPENPLMRGLALYNDRNRRQHANLTGGARQSAPPMAGAELAAPDLQLEAPAMLQEQPDVPQRAVASHVAMNPLLIALAKHKARLAEGAAAPADEGSAAGPIPRFEAPPGGLTQEDLWQRAEHASMQRHAADFLRAGGHGPTPRERAQLAAQGTYRVVDAEGREFTIDPGEGARGQQAQRRARLDEMDAAFGRASDPFVKTYYPAVRPALESGALAPEKALDAMMELRRLDDARAAREGRGRRGAGGSGTPRPGKPPTEGQARLALLGQQMLGELETLDRLPPLTDAALERLQRNATRVEAADRSASSGIFSSLGVSAARALGAVPLSKYEGLSPAEQQSANAWDNVVEKYTRLLTGAGMPVDEARRMALQDAVHAGDSDEVKAQKLARMRVAAAQMISLSGPAAERVRAAGDGSTKPAQPASGAAPAGGGRQPAPRANIEALKRRLRQRLGGAR